MPALPLTAVFDTLPDPRRDTENKLHRLTDILAITTCAVIGGAETWEAIAEDGRTKAAFLRRFLELPNGTPSPDTVGRSVRHRGHLLVDQQVAQVRVKHQQPAGGEVEDGAQDRRDGRRFDDPLPRGALLRHPSAHGSPSVGRSDLCSCSAGTDLV